VQLQYATGCGVMPWC